MPVEIKELVIRMVTREAGAAGAANADNRPTTIENQDTLVATCVKQVLAILEKKKKR